MATDKRPAPPELMMMIAEKRIRARCRPGCAAKNRMIRRASEAENKSDKLWRAGRSRLADADENRV